MSETTCGAYTYIGAGGDQYVGCRKQLVCKKHEHMPVPCSDASGAFKLLEHLHHDCRIDYTTSIAQQRAGMEGQ